MSESVEHSNLVAILHSYISRRFCEGLGELVYTDSIRSESRTRPPSIGGYVPDAYLMLDQDGGVVIGEAKSLGDLENSHTEAQVVAFLKRCGMAEGSTFILAVPWPVERLARGLLRDLQEREGFSHVDAVILSDVSQLGATSASGEAP